MAVFKIYLDGLLCRTLRPLVASKAEYYSLLSRSLFFRRDTELLYVPKSEPGKFRF
jgi:hypothetical protein